MKRFHRSEKNKVIAGICGGLEEYTGHDAYFLRFLWILFVIFTGIFPGVLAYVVTALIIPVKKTR